jgi:hypothetical protein
LYFPGLSVYIFNSGKTLLLFLNYIFADRCSYFGDAGLTGVYIKTLCSLETGY